MCWLSNLPTHSPRSLTDNQWPQPDTNNLRLKGGHVLRRHVDRESDPDEMPRRSDLVAFYGPRPGGPHLPAAVDAVRSEVGR